MHGLFFTGTDTGVGKTWITAGAARSLRSRGRFVRVCKPVATGATCVEGRLVAEDTVVLAEAAGRTDDWDVVTPWTFDEPVAPAVAARWHGVKLSLRSMIDAVRGLARPQTALLVEGVGGLLCPLTDKATVADLAVGLGFPVVIVARRSLGTINHTLLTLETAERRGLRIAGVVVNETAPVSGPAESSNVEELQRWLTAPILAVVAHREAGRPGPLPELDAVDWWQLGVSA